MYEHHGEIETPPDDVRIWRYMNLSQFLYLLHEGSLYFAQTHELSDPWEGTRPFALAGDLKVLFDLVAATAILNCWHMNDFESVAMWHLYTTGTDGIAISSTIGALKKAIERDCRRTLIGKVIYSDFKTIRLDHGELGLNAISPLFQKRKSYEHEAEVRAVVPFPDEPVLTEEEAKQIPPGTTFVAHNAECGTVIKVDLATLIQKIVVSPQFPQWAVPVVQNRVRQAGLNVVVELSDLLKRPEPNSFKARTQSKD